MLEFRPWLFCEIWPPNDRCNSSLHMILVEIFHFRLQYCPIFFETKLFDAFLQMSYVFIFFDWIHRFQFLCHLLCIAATCCHEFLPLNRRRCMLLPSDLDLTGFKTFILHLFTEARVLAQHFRHDKAHLTCLSRFLFSFWYSGVCCLLLLILH